MKTYSTRSNAKAGIIAFRKAHPDMNDVGINVVEQFGGIVRPRFALEAVLPSGATDALQTRLDELGFYTTRPAIPDPLPEASPEGPPEEVEVLTSPRDAFREVCKGVPLDKEGKPKTPGLKAPGGQY